MMKCRFQILPFTLFGLLAACGGGRPTVVDEEMPLRPRNGSASSVLAWVNDVPILVEDLRRQMGQDSAQGTSDALQSLIQQELLVQEARRRGLLEDPQVRREYQRALANLLIRRDFQETFTKEKVSDEMVAAAYKRNISRFVAPELVHVAHVVVGAAPGRKADFHRRAKNVAEEVRKLATARPLTIKEFMQIAKQVGKKHQGFNIKAEQFRAPRRGGIVPAFADAAFALKKPGDISPVVKTRYGYHVIYLHERLAARNQPLSEVKEEVRDRVFDQARQRAFRLWLKHLTERHGGKILDLPPSLPSGAGR